MKIIIYGMILMACVQAMYISFGRKPVCIVIED